MMTEWDPWSPQATLVTFDENGNPSGVPRSDTPTDLTPEEWLKLRPRRHRDWGPLLEPDTLAPATLFNPGNKRPDTARENDPKPVVSSPTLALRLLRMSVGWTERVTEEHFQAALRATDRESRHRTVLAAWLLETTVQTVAQWRARGLILTLRPSGVTVTDRAGASENGPFEEPNGIDSATMRRILDDTGVRIEQATFGRRAALAAIQAMPDQSKMLRLMIGDGGLDMWSTATETIGPNDQPQAHLGTETGERTHGPFGASRQHLLEALRTLQARELTIKLQPGRKTPLRLESPDTGETLLIMLAALQ